MFTAIQEKYSNFKKIAAFLYQKKYIYFKLNKSLRIFITPKVVNPRIPSDRKRAQKMQGWRTVLGSAWERGAGN